jgi:peptide-methionine (S)-S-oxide reductase
VCSGQTNHAEALEITFDPKNVSYETLVEFFYKMHGTDKNIFTIYLSYSKTLLLWLIDPTTINAQGPDKGTQYRSAIFYHSPEQKKIAEEVTEKVQKEHYKNNKIATEIIPAGTFYSAEDYHQVKKRRTFFLFLFLL